MSVTGLAMLARVRDEGAPTKGDVGKAPPGSEAAASKTSNIDLLSSVLPTGLVAAYSTCIAAITGVVTQARKTDATPNLHEPIRWIAFAALVVFAVLLVYKKYVEHGGQMKPIAEMLAAGVASVGWGLGMAESPLAVRLGEDYSIVVPVLIAFLSVGVSLLLTTTALQKPRS